MAGLSPWASRREMFFGQAAPALTHGFNKASAHTLLSSLKKLQESTDKMAALRSGEQSYSDASLILSTCIENVHQAALSSKTQTAPVNNQKADVPDSESVTTPSI